MVSALAVPLEDASSAMVAYHDGSAASYISHAPICVRDERSFERSIRHIVDGAGVNIQEDFEDVVGGIGMVMAHAHVPQQLIDQRSHMFCINP